MSWQNRFRADWIKKCGSPFRDIPRAVSYTHLDPHYTVLVKDGGSTIPEGAKDNLQAEKYRLRVCDKENLEASNRFFAELVEEMHKRGIRVIMDGVFRCV